MDLFSNLLLGFEVALSPMNLFFCFVGALIGTLIGVLPGLGPVATLAMLLPLSYYLEPTSAIIMLTGIYYGAQYGGSTTAILVNLPGEPSSIVTAIDGYSMAQNGRAGAALAAAAVSSFVAGTVATVLIAVASGPLTSVALQFSAVEYFSLIVFGLIGSVILAQGSVLKAIAMIFAGLLLSTVGTDGQSGQTRFTMGIADLTDGIDFVPVAMGLFGITEVMLNLEREHGSRVAAAVGRLWPTGNEVRQAIPATLRGTMVGSALGLLPGGGAMLSSFVAYALEKKVAKDPERFGKGAIEGVAGPEAANNAGAQTSFIPLLTLGLPSNAVMGLLIGALLIHGITPGPRIIQNQPELFWGVVASMWLGNAMLLVINLPLVGIWVKLLRVPYDILFPIIVVVCAIGAYTLNNSTVDIVVMLSFGAIGYLLTKLGFEPAPLVLGFLLGKMLDEYFQRSMQMSGGNLSIFLERPISLALLIASFGLFAMIMAPVLRSKRQTVFQEM
jgi:putative tricarboxylic transport membrane protein